MTSEHDNLTANPALESIAEAKSFLLDIAEVSSEAGSNELARATERFLGLVQIAEAAGQDQDILNSEQRRELDELIERSIAAVRNSVEQAPNSEQQLQSLSDEVLEKWGDSLDLADNTGGSDAFEGWGGDSDAVADDSDPDDDIPANVDLAHILSELKQTATDYVDGEQEVRSEEPPAPPAPSFAENLKKETSQPGAGGRILDDPDMAEAYLDDAIRCVASMEQSLLAYEADTNNRAALNQVCRELHTLKGASASVELNELAAFLHEVEDSVRLGCDPGSAAPDPSAILQSIDKVREQIDAIGGKKKVDDSEPVASEASAGAAMNFEQPSSSQEPTLRVKAAKVDRLMDMLAELVMLRNRRDSRVERLKGVQNELLGCASRVRGLDAAYSTHAVHRTSWEGEDPRVGTRSNSFTEVADDIFAASDELRGVSQPLDAENLAISQFIRQFRQELVEIRRVPAEGLFRRLQRAVRDAAKVEEKQVRLELVGEHTGIDRTLQESLYDPLLHVVRNAVSHGIERPADRTGNGKDAMGTVTMEARGGANFLVVEVRDDGKGLDYDALRRRGLERNLIKSDQPATEAELAQLIFHPGFSTQNQASEISGRGVGMDVVASAIERLRGWIEIESKTGHGCCIRITVPLESTIEHAMLFRDAKQIFAIPMRFVHTVNTGKDDQNTANVFGANAIPAAQVSFAEMFNRTSTTPEGETRATLVVGVGADESQPLFGGSVRVALEVDEIIGPEEVVMRPLPSLLRHQRLFSGVSLAGSGEIVLALDAQQLLERSARTTSDAAESGAPLRRSGPTAKEHESDTQPAAIVVDDSATARRAMVNMLKERGFKVTEATDGAEGLETLKTEAFDLLVSDLEMPRMDGLELLQAIYDTPEWESMTAILSSSRDDEEFQRRARELGAVAYLVKPVVEEQLDEVLSKYSFGRRDVRE